MIRTHGSHVAATGYVARSTIYANLDLAYLDEHQVCLGLASMGGPLDAPEMLNGGATRATVVVLDPCDRRSVFKVMTFTGASTR